MPLCELESVCAELEELFVFDELVHNQRQQHHRVDCVMCMQLHDLYAISLCLPSMLVYFWGVLKVAQQSIALVQKKLNHPFAFHNTSGYFWVILFTPTAQNVQIVVTNVHTNLPPNSVRPNDVNAQIDIQFKSN